MKYLYSLYRRGQRMAKNPRYTGLFGHISLRWNLGMQKVFSKNNYFEIRAFYNGFNGKPFHEGIL